MKMILVPILFIALSTILFSQTRIPDWQLALGVGGNDNDYGYAVDTDGNGNFYTTGCFAGTATFGTISLTSSGIIDIFVAKSDSAGNWLWAVKAGGTDADRSYGTCTDSNGNVYVTGYYSGTAEFGTLSLTSAGNYDIFVAKLDTSGNWLWAVSAGGTGQDTGQSVSLDSDGNIYIAGSFRLTSNFGALSLTCPANMDIFVAKLDSNGNWLWAVSGTGTGSNTAFGLATDTAGNSFMTGYFTSTATFGTYSLTSSSPTNRDILIAKVNTNGVWQWAKRVGSTQFDEGKGIALDGSGNCYVTGYFGDSVYFDTILLTSHGSNDIFIAKYDTNGNPAWAVNAGSTSDDKGFGIAVDSDNNCCGTGYYSGTCWFGSMTLTAVNMADIYVCALDCNGNWMWVRSAGGNNNDYGQGITMDSNSNIYCTGYYYSTSAAFGTLTITNPDQITSNIFLAKLNEPITLGVPLAPQNVVISAINNDINITWDNVTENTNGQPIEPVYNVYFCPDNPYLGFELIGGDLTVPGFLHSDGALLAKGFYYVTAEVPDR